MFQSSIKLSLKQQRDTNDARASHMNSPDEPYSWDLQTSPSVPTQMSRARDISIDQAFYCRNSTDTLPNQIWTSTSGHPSRTKAHVSRAYTRSGDAVSRQEWVSILPRFTILELQVRKMITQKLLHCTFAASAEPRLGVWTRASWHVS